MDISELEKKIGYIFVDKRLIERALTTKAWALEKRQQNPDSDENYSDQEVFSTLGDAVLKLILVDRLIKEGSDSPERITKSKQQIEKRETLGYIGKNFELGSFLRMGVGQHKQKINEQQNTLAETLEAVIAAIYLDVGFEASKRIVMKWDGFEKFFND
jgi:ribonuclease-3